MSLTFLYQYNEHNLACPFQPFATEALSSLLGKHSECYRSLPITGHYLYVITGAVDTV